MKTLKILSIIGIVLGGLGFFDSANVEVSEDGNGAICILATMYLLAISIVMLNHANRALKQ